MTNVLKVGKRAFTVGVVVTTIAWSIGLSALLLPLAASSATLAAGDLIKASLPSVYYYGADGKRYVFPNEKTYFTWFADFSAVKKITDAELAAIQIGGNATYKPGKKMVKITTDPKVYAVGANGSLRWVKSEAIALALYGANWNKLIDDVPDAFFTNYSIGAEVAAAADFNKASVEAAATSIDVDKNLAVAPGVPSAPAGSKLAIAAASDTPAAQQIVADTTGESSGQRMVPMMKVNFTAPADGAVKVNTVKVKRAGISADADMDQVYLYDGATKLVSSTSISKGVITFSGAPIFTVDKGATKAIDVKMDLNYDATSGKTVSLSLAAADVSSDAAAVEGSAAGNTMTVAVVEDLGQLELADVTYPADVNPSTTDEKELWRFKIDCLAQDVLIKKMIFTQKSSVSDDDIKDLKLDVGGVQVGSTVAKMTGQKATFDLTGLADGGYKCLAGQTKQLALKGMVIGGTNRSFQFSIQEQTDVVVYDKEYNVLIPAVADATDAFTVVNAAAATTVNTGKLTIAVASDSPSSNVPDEGVGVTLAKFSLTAAGEDVKFTAMTITATCSTTTNDLKNMKLMLDGVQVGTTVTSGSDFVVCDGSTDEAAWSAFGNSFIVPRGETKTLSVAADLNGTQAGGDTVYVAMYAATAEGKTSLAAVTVASTTARTVTIRGGTVSVVKNASFTDRTASLPTGVSNGAGVKIGSFIIIAGAGEAVDVTQIGLYDDDTTAYQIGDNFQNLKLKDSAGNQIGATETNPSGTAGTHTFTPSTSIRIAAGAQFVVDIFADIKSAPATTDAPITWAGTAGGADIISATGVTTGASATWGTSGTGGSEVALQTNYIAANGILTVDEDPDRPIEQQMVMGTTDQVFAKFKLSTTSTAEDITITQIIVADVMTEASLGAYVTEATGTIRNIKLYKGTELLGTVAGLDNATYVSSTTRDYPVAIFSGLNLTVPANKNVVLTVKADISSYNDGGISSSTHKLIIPVDYDASTVTVQDSITAVGAGSGFSISSAGDALGYCGQALTCYGPTEGDVGDKTMDIVRTKLTIAHADPTPSGTVVASAAQTVARFVVSNSANVGDYTATLKNMDLDIAQSGISIAQDSDNGRALYIYKDSVATANQLATTTFGATNVTSGDAGGNYRDTSFEGSGGGTFTDLEIAAGASKTLIVTLDTSDTAVTVNSDSLSVGIDANQVTWYDGVTNFYEIDTLPISGKALRY